MSTLRGTARHECGPILFAALALVGCGLPARERESVLDRWYSLALREEYADAADSLVPDDRAGWRRQTEQLADEHGRAVSLQRGDIAMSDDGTPTARLVLTWTDGATSCLIVRDPERGPIDVLGDGYQDCDRVPQPGQP